MATGTATLPTTQSPSHRAPRRTGLPPLSGAGVGLRGALGLAVVGTLRSALACAARFPVFLLPVLLFPLVLPVLVLASRMTGEALAGDQIASAMWGWLALYDWVFLLLAYFVFDYVLED